MYWYWSTGEDVGFTNWAYFEPSDNLLNSDEECVYMDYKGLWYDETCDKEYAFMCKHNGGFYNLTFKILIFFICYTVIHILGFTLFNKNVMGSTVLLCFGDGD